MDSIYVDSRFNEDTKRYEYFVHSFCELAMEDMIKGCGIKKDFILSRSVSEVIKNV